MKPSKALLVIDMQRGSFTPRTPRFDTPGVVARINELATLFRAHHYPVIFIQHDGTREASFVPGTTEWELLADLNVHSDDFMVSKTANDAFYRSALASILEAAGVNELFITGCATDFCVAATIQSAIVRNFMVTVVEDGHTTGERPHLSAKQVIDHYNWVWRNLLPTNEPVAVLSTQEIVAHDRLSHR